MPGVIVNRKMKVKTARATTLEEDEQQRLDILRIIMLFFVIGSSCVRVVACRPVVPTIRELRLVLLLAHDGRVIGLEYNNNYRYYVRRR